MQEKSQPCHDPVATQLCLAHLPKNIIHSGKLPPSAVGKQRQLLTHVTSPLTEILFFVLVLNVQGVYWGTSISIASVHQLTYQFTGTLQKRKCRKIYVINCRSKSRQRLFIEIAVWEDTKVNILTAALPTLPILW